MVDFSVVRDGRLTVPRNLQLLLGHASIQTTERYLGTEQNLAAAVNDELGLDLE